MIGQGICSALSGSGLFKYDWKTAFFQIILVLAVVVNFVLNSFLIPDYGMTGAAIVFL
jgi:hypothetical protein